MAGKRGRSGKNRRSAAYSTRAQIFKRQDISASEKRIYFLQSFQLSVSVFTAVIAHAAVVAGEEDDLLPDASTANERGDEHSHLILYAIAASWSTLLHSRKSNKVLDWWALSKPIYNHMRAL